MKNAKHDAEGQSDLETLSAVMAELRADAKPLAQDLVRGVYGYALLALISAIMASFTLILALIILLPKYFAIYYAIPYTGLALLAYPTVGFWITYKALRMYGTLSRKYSRLIEISEKLGD